MSPPPRTTAIGPQFSGDLIIALLLIYLPRKKERLRWPNWLTCSGLFIHKVVTRQLQVRRRTGKVRRRNTDVLPLCYANEP